MTRIDALRASFAQHEIDGLFITKSENLRYLTGFTGTTGCALVNATDAYFFTDFRYLEQAAEQCVGWKIVDTGRSSVDAVSGVLTNARGTRHLGFEQQDVTYQSWVKYQEWETKIPGLHLKPTTGLVERLRWIKSPEELERIQKAAAIADEAFAYMLTVLKPGLRESEAALELEFKMRRLGASGPSFDTIMASGVRSALPHGVASEKVLQAGDFVTMDFGAVFDGYVSDLTRTVVLGTPSEQQRKIYGIVLDAQLRSLEAVKPGMRAVNLDAVARDYIAEHGYGTAFGHSLGHGIGLEIHEEPHVSARSEHVLEPGMVITIEPGIYLPGFGGVRIEDDVVLTETGSVVLTHAPKELICL